MLKDALEYFASLVRNNDASQLTRNVSLPFNGDVVAYEYKLNPTEYGVELGAALTPFRPEALTVSTLTGFSAAIENSVLPDHDNSPAVIIHIEDPYTVSVKTAQSDVYGRRDTLLVAKHQNANAFRFDEYYDDLTRLIIALQSSFEQDEALTYLLRLASNMKAGSTVTTSDDGFSQTVEMKTGEVSASKLDLKPRIWLKPIRTFSEIKPVANEFLLRFKQNNNGMPSIALFNVNGTQWRNDTMQAIREYLKDIVDEIAILA